MNRWIKVVLVGLVLGLAANWWVRTRLFAPQPPEGATLGVDRGDVGVGLEVVATDLDVPWEVAFLPEGDFLVTERPGRLVRLAPDGAVRWRTDVPDVRARGEGGLLGLALDPAFGDTGWIYLYRTTETDNRVDRWTLGPGGELTDRTPVVDGIPVAAFHDGGRLHVGPDGMLWITTGDAGSAADARNPASLAGKILRVTPTGGTPETNPGGSIVWSLGHRNPQGLAWADDGTVWATEHGRSGFTSGLDEVNRIEAGGDYGWPEFQGDSVTAEVHAPVLHSGPSHTWAPSGAAWWNGRLFFGGLRGQALYDVAGLPGAPRLTVHFFREFGRIRQVRVGPDGMLYLLTGNRDGRGSPEDDDDRLLRLDPGVLQPR
ncbi:MAG: PQQ-dependent sugar dehydrogenase [Longimicrobiales bacterium]